MPAKVILETYKEPNGPIWKFQFLLLSFMVQQITDFVFVKHYTESIDFYLSSSDRQY